MKYVSTRGKAPAATLTDAIAAGLASDGGLYVPAHLPPAFEPADFDGSDSLADVAAALLAPFFEGDALQGELRSICDSAFDLPLPLRSLATPGDHVLELFHGPTAAFKDFGARFLAGCMSRIAGAQSRVITILVATSGDTGAAVAAAFHRQAGTRVVVLYPEGRVSPRQAHQLGCFGDNVEALRVDGSFDDCQRLVKQALNDTDLQREVPLSSANSISLGRLLPQMAYYAHASLSFFRTRGVELNFAIPTGNLGNALAGILARAVGMPIGRIALANNANDVLARFFAGEDYVPRNSVATLANAMDVGAPSNFERLRWLYGDDDRLRKAFEARAVSDETIRETIRERHDAFGELFDPHTATAVHLLEQLREEGADGEWAVVATAHPAKFESIVEPLIGRAVEVPEALAGLLRRPSYAAAMPADYASLRGRLAAGR